tara:strand:- start:578 stop:1291 length:714 start_codon:yes stop_codon:yes gene_type:complete
MYIKILHFIISYFDYPNKKKTINFFKKKFNNNISVLIDVGAHHGETIKLFNNKFKIKSILSFEPAKKSYEQLLIKNKNLKNVKFFNIGLGEVEKMVYFNDHFETQSSTISKINFSSNYYKKKNLFLNPLRNSDKKINVVQIKIRRLEDIINELKIENVDILKIDTEGYDFNVIKGLGNKISKVKYIFFEHHFHDMLIKKYKLSDINDYLYNNNFIKVFKSKMRFRKTFEYIYYNNSL